MKLIGKERRKQNLSIMEAKLYPPKCGLQKASTVFKRSSKCFCVHEKPEEELIMQKMQNLEDAGTIMDFYRRMLFSQRAFSMLVL